MTSCQKWKVIYFNLITMTTTDLKSDVKSFLQILEFGVLPKQLPLRGSDTHYGKPRS